ncbi:Fe-S cluster assembly ATPase SufC [Candidatus Gracilibacteria bacterium]|nr:Fe-S cluster assembly ATPase SufC [Candidatus Gracilibacteria bacterium]
MLELKDITIAVDEKIIVHNFSYNFLDGKTVAILGQNGSGKSSLALALAGHPRYLISGFYSLSGVDMLPLGPGERHRAGIFLSFQNIPEIPGIKVSEFLRTIYNEHFLRVHPGEKVPSSFVFKRIVEKLLPSIHLDSKFLERDLFVGFSGGEKRRIELLQIALLEPSVIILDEIDSGLDIDALGILRQHIDTWRSLGKTVIIISHNFQLIDSIHIDGTILMKDGQIIRHGDDSVVEDVKKDGFNTL